MAKYEINNITEDSFVIRAYSFTSDLTRYFQILVNYNEVFNDTISNWLLGYANDGLEIWGLDPCTKYIVTFYIGDSDVWYENIQYERLEETTSGCDDVIYPNYVVDTTNTTISSGQYKSDGNIYFSINWVICENFSPSDMYRAKIWYKINDSTNSSCDEDDTEGCLSFSVSGDDLVPGGCAEAGTSNVSYYVGPSFTDETFDVTISGYIRDSSPEPLWESFKIETTIQVNVQNFYWKSASDRPAWGKAISSYITASKWNALCTDLGLTSLADKTSGSSIIGSEVRQVLLAAGGSSDDYPESSFQAGQPILAKWFTDIEDLYNS